MNVIKRWLAPPVFAGDDEKTYVARFLNLILLATMALLAGLVISELVAGDETLLSRATIANTSMILLLLGLRVVLRRGYVRAAGLILVAVGWVNLTYQAWFAGGVRDTAFLAYIIIILLANLFVGWRAGLVTAGLTVLAGWVFAYAEASGLIPTQLDPPYEIALETTFIFGLAAIILALTIASLTQALQQARRHERELAESNRELQTIRASLEEQVAERTHRMEMITLLGDRLSAILDLNELLVELVNQVQERFGYYHVHVYLLDELGQNLVVAEGTGPAGEAMKTQGHRISLTAPASLVARAARLGEVVSVDDVQAAADWLPNPLLPETRSEMAVPIALGVEEQLVGVLDVQSEKIAGLDQGDADLLRSLANHVAVAIRNARLFAEEETMLAEAQAIQEQYLEQTWTKAKMAAQAREHLYVRPGLAALPETSLAQAKEQALAQKHPALVTLQPTNQLTNQPTNQPTNQLTNQPTNQPEPTPNAIVAPVTLGHKTIGALQLHQVEGGGESQPWTEEDLALVEAVLDQVAQAAENLRLFEETRERASYEQLLGQITDRLRQTSTLDDLAKTAAEELGRVLGVSHSLVKVGVTPPPEHTAGNGEQG